MKFKRVLLLFGMCLMFTATPSYAQNLEKTDKIELPSGVWTLSYPPASKIGLADAPALILSTTANAKNHITITKVGLENLSGKTIVAVKFQWFLYREESPEKNEAKGETASIGTSEFAPKEKREIEYPIVSFGKIYHPLVKNGKLEGKFAIEVAVSEILYDDGSKWIRA